MILSRIPFVQEYNMTKRNTVQAKALLINRTNNHKEGLLTPDQAWETLGHFFKNRRCPESLELYRALTTAPSPNKSIKHQTNETLSLRERKQIIDILIEREGGFDISPSHIWGGSIDFSVDYN